MVEHKCEICNYITYKKSNYNTHVKSNKHLYAMNKKKEGLNKEDSLDKILEKEYKCEYCNSKFKSQPSYSRHKNRNCKKIKILNNATSDVLKIKLQEAEEKINKLTKINNELQKKLMTTIKAPKTMNVYNYVQINFPKVPKLKELKNPKKLLESKNDNSLLENTLLINYEKGNLPKYIGDSIVSTYKTGDPNKQSLWTTDKNKQRLSYVIYTVLQNVTGWHVDKGGIEMTKKIIKPITSFIRELIEDYHKELCNIVAKKDYTNTSPLYVANQLKNCIALIDDIENEKLDNAVNQYIAVHFYISKTMRVMKKLENNNSEDEEDINNLTEIE